MKFAPFLTDDRDGLAILREDGRANGLLTTDKEFPGTLDQLVARGGDALSSAAEILARGAEINLEGLVRPPLLRHPGKIICIGLNYYDHSAESGFQQPDYPAVFGRFSSSLIGHGAPIVRPKVSVQLDYEGELAVVIGTGGRSIAEEDALSHVAGYSVFNDASIRDFQFRSQQWTMGKNFDGTGAFGPVLVTADALPSGCRGLRLSTRLNGVTVQSALIDDMVFDVARQISIISQVITLAPGDVLVTGTPSGVGLARSPRLWMKPGDICEVEVDRIGVLRNVIVDEADMRLKEYSKSASQAA